MIKQPRVVIITQICTAKEPIFPKFSFINPAYVVDWPAYVALNMKFTVMSTNKATRTIKTNAGTTPRTFKVAGIDIIPAPIIVVDTLNTALHITHRFSLVREL